MSLRAAFLLVLLAPAAAPLSGQLPRTRDSAGVRIVENAARTAAAVAFTVGTTLLDIGGVHDNPDDDLDSRNGDIRGYRFADGAFAVTDGWRIRYYDRQGKPTKVVGRRGEGPQEFGAIIGACLVRDTLLVGDGANARIAVLDRQGNWIRFIPMRDGKRFYGTMCYDDGSIGTVRNTANKGDGLYSEIVRVDRTGTTLGTFGPLWTFRGTAYGMQTASLLGSLDRMVIGDPRTSEVRIHTPAGVLRQIVRLGDRPREVTSAEEAGLKQVVGGFGSARPTDKAKPDLWPMYDRVMMDETGRLWLQDARLSNKASSSWTAFDATGKMIGRLGVPTIGTKAPVVAAFHADAVQLFWRDEDGAVHLRWARLVAQK